MDKLSERLWVMRVSLENLTDDELATFDEAIELAERYEDAPVVATDEDGDLFVTMYPDQRYRLVREPAMRDG